MVLTLNKGVSTLIEDTGIPSAIVDSLPLISKRGEIILLGSSREEYKTDLADVLQNIHLEPRGSIEFKEAYEWQYPVKTDLFVKHSIEISISEIELLIDKFIFYLAAVHQESIPLIRAEIQAKGGYILHIDATCEGDSPELVASVDPVSGFVLYSAKINSENRDELMLFLE